MEEDIIHGASPQVGIFCLLNIAAVYCNFALCHAQPWPFSQDFRTFDISRHFERRGGKVFTVKAKSIKAEP